MSMASDIKTIQIEDIIKGSSQLQITYQAGAKPHEGGLATVYSAGTTSTRCEMTPTHPCPCAPL